MSINQISKEAQLKAHDDFIEWAEEMGHDNDHTLEEFVELSEVNGWEYDEDGNLI